jgi:hypothetical protein
MADAPDLPPDQYAADEAARAVYADGAAEVASESAAAESELAKTYTKASSDVRALIRQQGDGATRATVANDVERVLDGALLSRTRVIAATVRTANVKGVERAKRTFDVVYGDQRTRAQIHLRPKALEEASARIAGRTTVDGVGLAKRIKRHDKDTVQAIAREVDDIFRGTKGALDAADKIAKIEGAVPVKLAAYQQEMVDAVKHLDSLTWSSEKARKSAVKQAVGKHLKYIESLGELQPDGTRRASAYSLRGSSKRFAQQLQTARGADIDRVVEKQLEERALWRARVIARHESNLAYDAAYIEQTKDKPGTIGYRWQTSNRHPRPDECDCYAAANYDGLGPGVYKPENLPSKHPLCICTLSVVLDAKVHDRPEGSPKVPDEFRDNVSPGPESWYRQNPGPAVAILGERRYGLMQQGVTVIDQHGTPLRFADIFGAAKAAE